MDSSTITHSAQETQRAAGQFAVQVKAGDVICLHGDLGAGKTTWVKGLALGLGLPEREAVTSPTFAIMHRYSTVIPIYHFDCYRITSPNELTEVGFEEFIHLGDAVVCVEWPEKAGDLIPPDSWHVFLRHQEGGGRAIQIQKR